MMVSPDFLTQFEAERDALRATNRQLAEANATLTAELAALAARITEFERLQQVWLMSPEAAQRLQGYRDLAGKCAELTVELAEARALNAQLAAQVDDARPARSAAPPGPSPVRSAAAAGAAGAGHTATVAAAARRHSKLVRRQCWRARCTAPAR